MLNRRTSVPPGYSERECLLIQYSLPLLKHCFIICHEPGTHDTRLVDSTLTDFALAEARKFAREHCGDPESFILIQSGNTVRKRKNWHVHVVIISKRWQKAWLYVILSLKNICQTIAQWVFGNPNSSRQAK